MNKRSKFLIAACGLLAILNSCKDNTGTLGPQVLPKSDLIYAYQTDTTTIVTSMYLEDSAATNDLTTSLLGSYNDPVFGETKASIYAEVSPANAPTNPWANNNPPIVDSAVMLLILNGPAFGGNDPQTYVVYALDNDIATGHAYYSDTAIKFSSNSPIGEAQITPPPLTVPNDTIRIKLTQAFTNSFVYNTTQGPIVNGAPSGWSTKFNSTVMHGVCITTLNPLQLPGQGSIVSVNLSTSTSGIYVYYHSPNASEYSAFFAVGGSTYGEYFDNFTHNYSTSAISMSRPSGPRDSISAGQLIYLQGMAGVQGRINFPNLYKNWSKKGPIVINAAELTLPIDVQYNSNSFQNPSQLYVVGTQSNWVGYAIPDEYQPYYGGNVSNNVYTFYITEYIQSIIDGKNDSDRGLYIVPSGTQSSPIGVVLYGAQHSKQPANRACLTIYYTPLKKN